MTSPQEPSPPAPAPKPAERPTFSSQLRRVFSVLAKASSLFFLAFGITLAILLYVNLMHPGQELRERFYLGNKGASDKIAVIRVEGILFEGFTSYVEKQIDAAAKDDQVKAIVLRIVSPGGTITASDLLHRRLNELRQGKNLRSPGKPKPMVVSLGSLAASGGYYIAMIDSHPQTLILAEPATITGSIGVYASFPNVQKTLDKIGARMEVIKAGDLKASGSPFADPDKENPTAKLVWQHMVDHAYLRFLEVIRKARPQLTEAELQKDRVIDEKLLVRREGEREQHLHYPRYLADGGIYTAQEAITFKLVDEIGYLEDAVGKAAALAALKEGEYKVVLYDRPQTFLGSLLGIKEQGPPLQLDAGKVSGALSPRLWYLAPRYELSGLVTALGR